MTWNYRVCHRPSVAGGGHNIHEVYYDDKGRVKFYSERPVSAFGDDVQELYEDFANMWKAFDDEPLDLDRVDKKLMIQMVNEEFNDVYDKHTKHRNPDDPESKSK
jgi:hypothetical protein